MPISSLGGYTSSSKLRISGLATGLDTDSLIKQLMTVERAPYDKLEQKKQLVEWKISAYRDITGLVKGLKDEYFDVAKMSSNLLSQAAYKTMNVSSSSTAFSAVANADATAGTYKIKVDAIASAGSVTSSGAISKDISASQPFNYEGVKGKKFMLSIDGVTQQITIPADMSPVDTETETDALLRNLNSAIAKAFGEGKVTVSVGDSNILKFSSDISTGVTNVSIFTPNDENQSAVAELGFTTESSKSNRISTSTTLSDLRGKLSKSFIFNHDDKVRFSINNVEFVFGEEDTLQDVFDKVNANEAANVRMTYDTLSDSVKVESKRLGAGTSVNLSDEGGDFLKALNLLDETNGANFTQGKDAVISVNGQKITRSDNSILINGITIKLKDVSTTEESITITRDTDALFKNIKDFVNKYNEMLGKVNTKLAEKYDRSYQPLTSEQRSAMTDDQIEKWEAKAKTGILRNDSILQNMLDDMNRALTDSVKGQKLSLRDIGIASTSWSDRGVLTIDEEALKAAIAKDPDAVQSLFTAPAKELSSNATAAEKTASYQSQGIASRFFDVIETNIRTIRDSNGKKGLLLEQAGITGDFSEYSNVLYNEITDYQTRMTELASKLDAKEIAYYQKYSALETAMSKLSAQSNWLTSQLSSLG